MTKILVVDDNVNNVDLLVKRFSKLGFDCFKAFDGKEAIKVTQEENPDIILMDLQMPVLDGWEATEQIKNLPNHQKTPIIAVSAHTLREGIERAYKNGCDGFIAKPVNFKNLVKTIEKYVVSGK